MVDLVFVGSQETSDRPECLECVVTKVRSVLRASKAYRDCRVRMDGRERVETRVIAGRREWMPRSTYVDSQGQRDFQAITVLLE